MDRVKDYALSFVGLPYKYGGNNPLTGFDCSGLACEIGRSSGVVPHGVDLSSQALADWFIEQGGRMNVWGPGSFAFYGKSWKEITHVGFCLDQYRMVEAGGGDHLTLDHDTAALKNAFVRVRLIRYRKDFLGVIKPNYAPIGLAI